MSISVYEVTDFEHFVQMKDEWNHLLSVSYSDIPFLRHEWFVNWWLHFGTGKRLVIFLAKDEKRLVFAMPMMQVNVFSKAVPFIILQSLTNYHSYRYHFILKQGREDVISYVFDYIRHRPQPWHLLLLEFLPSDFPCHRLLVEAARNYKHKAEIWTICQSPYLPRNSNWEDYYEGLNKKFRMDLIRQNKRLCKLGFLEYENLHSTSNLYSDLQDAFDIEKKSWKGERGTAIACSAILINFYTEWAKIAEKEGWLCLSFLKLNGIRISFQYQLRYKDCMYCMKIGYDPAYKPYSIGQILQYEIIRDCFQSGVLEYDLFGPTSEYKKIWTTQSRNVENLFIYNRHLSSKLHFFYKFKVIPVARGRLTKVLKIYKLLRSFGNSKN
jgi:hypothetical protein